MRRLPKWLQALGNTADGVFVTDGAQRIVLWNKAMENLLGRSASRSLGRLCYEILRGKDPSGNIWCQANCTVRYCVQHLKQVENFELLTTTVQGLPIHTSITIIALPKNLEPWTVHIVRDITHASRLEEDIETIAGALRSHGLVVGTVNGQSERADALEHIRSEIASKLSRRELEVLQLLAKGLETLAIADQLHISRFTVRNHVRNILSKLAVHSRTHAVSALLEVR